MICYPEGQTASSRPFTENSQESELSTPAHDLTGVGVLVTRAAHQAGPLCELITAHGGRPICFPAIAIREPLDISLARTQLAQLSSFDIAIFVSPNAARCGLALLEDQAPLDGLAIGAIGKGTAAVLEHAGVKVSIVPQGRFDSESLLESAELTEVAGQQIAIFRGDGGRQLLGDVLQQRGANVVYIEVYTRVQPEADEAKLLANWEQDVQIVTVTSNNILDNLVTMLGTEGMKKLCFTPLVVISKPMQNRAQELECRHVILAHRADDQSVLEAVRSWAKADNP